MKLYTQTLKETNDDISQLVAQKLMISKNSVYPFTEMTEFLTELLANYDCDGVNLISIGSATPDIAIAADRANIEMEEVIGKSAFSYSLTLALEKIQNGDIVYIANPNKLNGANFSLSGLKTIIEKNYNGLIIIDEYYFDFFGISGLPLIDLNSNVIVLRSFTAPFGIYSSDAGYAVASPERISKCNELLDMRKISNILRKTILATMVNDEVLQERLHEIHEESLRLTKELTALGVQCRISATDFLLLRVASPKDAGNYLTSQKIEIENLEGYPKMEKYIRYRIASYFSNNKLISAFENMPDNYYVMKSIDRDKSTFHKPNTSSTTTRTSVDDILNAKIKERSTSAVPVEEKHLFKIMD